MKTPETLEQATEMLDLAFTRINDLESVVKMYDKTINSLPPDMGVHFVHLQHGDKCECKI